MARSSLSRASRSSLSLFFKASWAFFLSVSSIEMEMKFLMSPLGSNANLTTEGGNETLLGKRAIAADTALRLARYFETTERFWMELQTHYDLEVQKERLGPRLEEQVKVFDGAG